MPAIAKRASNKITALTPPSFGKREKAVTVPAKSTKKPKAKVVLPTGPVPPPMAGVVCSLMKVHPVKANSRSCTLCRALPMYFRPLHGCLCLSFAKRHRANVLI